MNLLLVAAVLGMVSPETLLIKTIRNQGWCERGIAIDRLSLSRPWEKSLDQLIILNDPPIGNIRFESFQSKISGTAIVRCMERVAVAAHDLTHAEKFVESNIRWVDMDVSASLRSGFYRDAAELKALEARGFIRSGTLLTRMQVQKRRAISAGSTVQLVVEKPPMRMTAVGRALQSGGENEWIRVENISTHKVVTGRVVGDVVVVGIGGT